MVSVNCICCSSRLNSSRLAFGNILAKHPQGKITDLHLGYFSPEMSSYTVGRDMLNNILSLFTFNDKGILSGCLHATEGTQIFDAIMRLAKKNKI